MEQVALVLDDCVACNGVRDIEVGMVSTLSSSGYCLLAGCTDERSVRCLHCGVSQRVAFRPGVVALLLNGTTHGSA